MFTSYFFFFFNLQLLLSGTLCCIHAILPQNEHRLVAQIPNSQATHWDPGGREHGCSRLVQQDGRELSAP